jgi:hypothetical protein
MHTLAKLRGVSSLRLRSILQNGLLPVPQLLSPILITISFLHGKLNGLLEDSMEEKGTILHPWEMVDIARKNDIPIFYCFHPYMKPGFTIAWNDAIEMQKSLNVDVTFEAGSWQVFKIRWIATGCRLRGWRCSCIQPLVQLASSRYPKYNRRLTLIVVSRTWISIVSFDRETLRI